MNKCHTPLNWQNDTTPAINDTNLNYMDGCIETIDDRVVAMDTTKANVSDLGTALEDWDVDNSTGDVTLTFKNGQTEIKHTNLSKIALNAHVIHDPEDPHYQQMEVTYPDGTKDYIDFSSFVTNIELVDSPEIHFTHNDDGTTSGSIINGSITANKLQPNFLADCQSAANTASTAATSANASRLESEGWAVGKQDGVDVPSTSPYYHNNAKYFAERTGGVSLEALNDVAISDKQPDDSLVWDEDLGKWVNKNVSTKFALLPVSNVTATPTDTTVALSWTNPGNVLVGGTVVAEFYKTKIIRKEGSAPTDITDGTEVYDDNGTSFTDTDLTESTTYYYAFYAYTDKDVYSDATVESVTTQGQGHLLPDDYQQVMYCESADTTSGSSTTKAQSKTWVDTGILNTDCDKIEYQWERTSTHSVMGLGATVDSAGNGRFALGHSQISGRESYNGGIVHNSSSEGASGWFDNGAPWGLSHKTTVTYTIGGTLTMVTDGTSYTTTTHVPSISNRTMFLHAIHGSESGSDVATWGGASRFSYVKFYKNNNLIGYMVACYRKSDGKPGYYDVVREQFIVNEGTTELTCGVSVDALPDGYTQVEYIQSTGTQYIDTGVQPSTSLTKIDFSAFDISYDASTKTQHIFGAYISGKGAFMTGASSAAANYRYYNGTWYISDVASSINHISVQITPSALTINGNATSISGVASNHSETMIIFGAMNNGVTTLVSFMKLCHFRIARSGTYIRDFIPCKNASNVVGFYDCVNGVFYDNDGTGVFTAGPDIEEV